jgi:hypothetical protein
MSAARPALPNEGTDNDRLLVALQGAYPGVLWNPSSKLVLTAHSRASDLRKLGWDILVERRRSPRGVKKGKQQYGYRLETPRKLWPAGDGVRGRWIA